MGARFRVYEATGTVKPYNETAMKAAGQIIDIETIIRGATGG